MNETGAVKFHYEFTGKELAPFPGFEELNAARQELRRLGLLGVDESGIGFGNLSMRDGATDSFYITGSGTGGLPSLRLVDYAKVIAWDFERNWLCCEGREIASAESLTHAAVYSMAAEVRVVVHGHDEESVAKTARARSCHWRGCRLRHARNGEGGPAALSRNRGAREEDFRHGRPQRWDRRLRRGFPGGAGCLGLKET